MTQWKMTSGAKMSWKRVECEFLGRNWKKTLLFPACFIFLTNYSCICCTLHRKSNLNHVCFQCHVIIHHFIQMIDVAKINWIQVCISTISCMILIIFWRKLCTKLKSWIWIINKVIVFYILHYESLQVTSGPGKIYLLYPYIPFTGPRRTATTDWAWWGGDVVTTTNMDLFILLHSRESFWGVRQSGGRSGVG